MKTLIKTLFISLLTLGLVACSTPTNDIEIEKPWPTEITYSNLNDEESRKLLTELMNNAGISENRQVVLFEHIDQINELLKPNELTNGFETHSISEPLYSPYELQDAWEEKYSLFFGYNCHITAYSLYSDFLKIPEGLEIKDDMLVFDRSALETDRSAILHEQDLNNFLAFYSFIPTSHTQDINVHLNNVKNSLDTRDIEFIENDNVSLISVVFHDTIDDDRLFVGHAGLLFTSKDNELYFLEKISFQEPYQLCKIESRAALSDYLMAKYDVAVNQDEAAPFVLENNQLIEGYRNHQAN